MFRRMFRARASTTLRSTTTPSRRVLEGSCTCPFFAENGACKHIWAVLLASEREGLLSAAAKDRCTLLVDVEPEDDPDPLDDDEYETPGRIDPSFRRKKPVPQQSQRASSHLLSWKQHFNSCRSSSGSGRTVHPVRGYRVRPIARCSIFSTRPKLPGIRFCRSRLAHRTGRRTVNGGRSGRFPSDGLKSIVFRTRRTAGS